MASAATTPSDPERVDDARSPGPAGAAWTCPGARLLAVPGPLGEAGRAEGGAADPLSPARNSMLRHSIVARMSITSFQASESL